MTDVGDWLDRHNNEERKEFLSNLRQLAEARARVWLNEKHLQERQENV